MDSAVSGSSFLTSSDGASANRSKRRTKGLLWDSSGLVLVWKRLEQGGFKWPPIMDGVMQLSPAQLAALIEGLDWTRVHVRETVRPIAVQ